MEEEPAGASDEAVRHCADLVPALSLALMTGDEDAVDVLLDGMHEEVRPYHGAATLVVASGLTLFLNEVLQETGRDPIEWMRKRMERPPAPRVDGT